MVCIHSFGRRYGRHTLLHLGHLAVDSLQILGESLLYGMQQLLVVHQASGDGSLLLLNLCDDLGEIVCCRAS